MTLNKKRIFFGTSISLASIAILVSSILLGRYALNQHKALAKELSFEARNSILFISSNNFSSKNVYEQILGIQSVTMHNSITLDAAFMDSDIISDKNYETSFYNNLKFKMDVVNPYDLILAGDDKALDFILKYRKELFKEIPVVFFGIENPVKARYASTFSNLTGFAQHTFLEETIEMAHVLNPKTDSVTIIVDNTVESHAMQVQIYELAKKKDFLNFNIINASLLTLEEFTDTLQNLSSNTILIMDSCSFGLDFAFSQKVQEFIFVTSNTKIPVYSYSGIGLTHGIAGGVLINNWTAGKHAAELALQILSGISPQYVSLKNEDEGIYIFDDAVLKKYGLNARKLPKDSIILNSWIYSWRLQKQFFILNSIFFISFIFLVILISILSLLEHKHVSDLKKSQKIMEHLITHDFLTELPNRKLLTEVFYRIKSKGIDFSVLLIDLDDFKSINDYHSHSCGDLVLKTISKRFSALMIDNRLFISRFGGDEFLLIYTKEHMDEDNPDLLKLISVFSEPISYRDEKIFVHASVGIVNSDPKYDTLDEYATNADIAMYEAKKQGKNQFAFYTDDLKEEIQDTQKITNLLKDAVENDGFKILYQPQIDITTNTIYGYEALVRLKADPIPPGIFIPVAEENGSIIKIARIVTEKVIQQIAEWRKKHVELHKIAINYSYAQIKDKNYPQFLKGLLQTYDISPNLITIEITESLFIENKEESLKLFEDFKNIGVSLSLDDFGTGYSSLSYLTYLPVETVKIDKSLVDHYLTDDKDKFIQNIVNLVHSLEMKLTVEGVESEMQYYKLKDFNCDYIQGYYFSKPIASDKVENFKIKVQEKA